MKLIQQSKLYFKEGNSDKVYEIDLLELSSTEYIVNFRYGRRGSTLKSGTKTPEAVSRDKAEAIFFQLDREKRTKGYQTEIETFIEIPSLDHIEPSSLKGVILQRLQDAIEGRNRFETTWKTSRVIWKAASLNIRESIPFIIKLATKGKDELQIYSAFWALTKFKAVEAKPVFESFAFQQTQKAYLRNIACEGLLNVLEGDDLNSFTKKLIEQLPLAIQQDIQNKDAKALINDLTEHSEQLFVGYFSTLYLLCKVQTELLPLIHQTMNNWTFRPPYFKQIRSIYKLAQVRNDYHTLAMLSYRFEKEKAMFAKTKPYSQYIPELDKYIQTEKEIKNRDSKIAFSQLTKAYFQRNAVNYLLETGEKKNAQEYIKLAVAILLQYSEADYSEEEEKLQNSYGIYQAKNRYSYIFVTYPECSRQYLLSNILFGNDPQRIRLKNLTYISGKREVICSTYYYNTNKIISDTSSPATTNNNDQKTTSTNSGQSFLGSILSLFGSKQKEEKEDQNTNRPTATESQKEKETITVQHPELFPEHWHTMPNAYVQLLLQAQMNIIHRFSYQNLKAHESYDEICTRFDSNTVLFFLKRNFEYPNKLGFEILAKREDEFKKDPSFVVSVLDSNSNDAREWAQRQIENEKDLFVSELNFILKLISNSRKENVDWIDNFLKNSRFTEERQQVILGKIIAELVNLENTEANNELAKLMINRLNLIASNQFNQISWEVVEHLLLSPLLTNIMLASKILLIKSQRAIATDIPVSLVSLFLKYEIPEVRQDGIRLLNQYPDNFLIDNYNFLLNQIDTAYPEVLENVLVIIRRLVGSYSVGNSTTQHLVYTLIRKEKYEGAHALIQSFVVNELKRYWNTGLTPKDIIKLIHAQYRISQLAGYEILKGYHKINDFTIRQIISLGNHELLLIRQWCWNYFKQNVYRIRYEKGRALGLLDANWDDTRTYAFQFFRTEFTENDWDSDTLIGIVDSIRADVENFGKELIARFFKPENALEYLSKLSEHPSVNVQELVTHYLNQYAGGKKEIISELNYYFRSVLTRVNKARVAKNRIFRFLHQEALKNESIAKVVVPILDDLSAQSTVQDKATCIHILSEVKAKYPHLDMHLMIKN